MKQTILKLSYLYLFKYVKYSLKIINQQQKLQLQILCYVHFVEIWNVPWGFALWCQQIRKQQAPTPLLVDEPNFGKSWLMKLLNFISMLTKNRFQIKCARYCTPIYISLIKYIRVWFIRTTYETNTSIWLGDLIYNINMTKN